MEITGKERSSYEKFLRRECAKHGHDFMLRINLAGPFYECCRCGEKRTVSAMKAEVESNSRK